MKYLQNIINPSLLILIAVVIRLLPHPANVAPIGALALFGGVYLNKKYALVVPLIAMVISDYFLGFDTTMPFVYGSFFLIGLLGLWLRDHKSPQHVVAGSLLGSVLFFLITNFGVWLVSGMYAKTFSGLLACYVAGLPFFRNTIIGDLFYTGVFFGGFELVEHTIQNIKPKTIAHI